jgi:hypothetical protein
MGIFGLKRVKPRKCRCGCGQVFTPSRPLQTVSSPACALVLIERRKAKEQAAAEKIERADIKARKLELKPLQYWLKRAEKAFNAWVLVRDREQGCISCGRFEAQAFHAGHHVSVGASSALRFDPANVHKQCNQCNIHLAGNQEQYATRLPARIGQDEVDRLKNAPRSRKWQRAELQAIEQEYKLKLKGLNNE